ncbi:NAD-dependent deacetylase sirtuin-5 [Aureobasidium melanogenum CBS 110374]|uniref:NAD-dependent deacetylase sirtuin-5 n=1 Tax=Aureobasidium melanogenum (strain CBS 110374) TaxID=1043003 RepID=A0A074VHH9_AURM1|nr:NAD-dependent deacetylase sirtuin-5 [Aureobasidium melanogenum CBS 110374]KEQ60145.1 NAD-dependent deacetylase sirtuin-5 [Aureobasidium melanogenum CBS 110374]
MSSDIESFTAHLQSSKRILALLGAGLSASSGLPTFRGAGGLWRTHDATSLATPEAFARDPALVWQFYSYRRHMALKASPNRAHLALAELATKHPGFLALSQNVDGLSQRARHPPEKLQLLHGSLFNVKCTSFYCSYHAQNFTDPIVPALKIPLDESDPTTKEARHAKELDIADAQVHLPSVQVSDLPKCPECHEGLLRPGVVWFGESLPSKVLNTVDKFISDSWKIDLIMVIGTSASVYPAAAYVDDARAKGARVAVINADRADEPAGGLRDNDWFFEGDAAQIVPDILKSVIGEIEQPAERL